MSNNIENEGGVGFCAKINLKKLTQLGNIQNIEEIIVDEEGNYKLKGNKKNRSPHSTPNNEHPDKAKIKKVFGLRNEL